MIRERGGEDKVAARRELPGRTQNPGAKDSELRDSSPLLPSLISLRC